MSDKPMSPERAIIVLNNLNTDGRIDVDRDELRAAVKTAKEALKLRVPVKPHSPDIIMGKYDPTGFKCPTCKNTFPEECESPCCGQCGQALNWSDN